MSPESCQAYQLASRAVPLRSKVPSNTVAGARVTHVAFAAEGKWFTALLAALASTVDHSHTPHQLHAHIFSDCRSYPKLVQEVSRFWCRYDSRGAALTLYELNAIQFSLTATGCPQHCQKGIFAK
jgi:hypothetical protein